ncbi:DUF2079 domain-containing protein [Microbacterium sp. B2969]|uniref:DUF2079 domain-containing protein n=1 Tax=Microbacterium alkaliflavum TaxID=3248839 RepID=A0ABW7QDC9_9MICO
MTITPIRALPTTAPRTPDRRTRTGWIASFVVGVIVAATYIVYAAWQWSQFTVKSWDLSIFAQLLDNYARLQPPIVNIKGDGYNLLGDHFHPLLALIAPVYAVAPHAFTLLVVQAVCFAVAAAVLTRTATDSLATVAGGILLGLAFAFSWGLQYAAEAQFHEIALAIPLITLSLSALLERRDLATVLWAAPLVFVKEDLGLTVAIIGLLVAYRSRKPLGLWLTIWGIGWFAIAVFIVLPILNPQGSWAYATNANPLTLLADPAGLFHPSKGLTLTLILVISGGLVLRSPIALVLLPTLGWRFLSSNHGYWGPSWHYSAILMPIVFVALLDGINRGPATRWAWVRSYSRHGAAIAVTAATLLLPTLPLWSLLTRSAWEPADRAEAATTILDTIPAGSSVETDIGLMSYLVDDHDVYWLGNTNPTPDCILIDRIAGGTPNEWGTALEVAARLHPGVTYHVIAKQSGYELACHEL